MEKIKLALKILKEVGKVFLYIVLGLGMFTMHYSVNYQSQRNIADDLE